MNKRKTPKNLQKPPPIVDTNITTSENLLQFELELTWCVQQLEQSIYAGKLSQKIADETSKNIKTLKSSTVPLIRKRQLMKNIFGDYRAKMRDEEKKLALAAKQIKFTPNSNAQPKYNFVKKSAILTSGKDFRFNFTAATDEDNKEQKSVQSDLNNGSNPTSKLNLTTGQDFKFNFTISDEDDINLNGLSLKS